MKHAIHLLMTRLRHRAGGKALAAFAGVVLAFSGPSWADVPLRALPSGAVPNPGTQQQELANITAPAEWNVFEFVVTCGACHGGTVDQHVGHFGNWAGGNMASAARDPVFRANQIGVNNVVKSITGQDGAGNVCFRCHSPNGWLSGRFDPTMGGKADGSTMIQSILLSTDTEGIMCETCHRTVGNVTFKRPDVATNSGTGFLDKVWNLLGGLFDWEHDGRDMVDQAGDPMIAEGLPYGDTSLQFLDGMSYVGKYSGMVDVYFSDLPIGGSYTGQIYAVYPDWWISEGYPIQAAPAGAPTTNSAGQVLAYNADGTLPPLFEAPVGTPMKSNGLYDFSAQAISIEHPTFGAKGRKHSAGDAANNLLPVLPAGNGGSASPNEFIRTSEFCGSCHDLTVPILNHGMPEQRTYSEWKFSSYALPTNAIADPLNKRTGTGVERCQDCHMPTLKHEYADDNSGAYNADPTLVGGFPYGKDRGAQGGTAVHKLTGANRDLPMMMKALYPEVDLEVIGAPAGRDPRAFPGMLSDRSPMYDRAKQNTEITLRDGVDVKVTQPPTEVAGQPGVYEMKVKVLNKSGHRIPSGYPDGRRFWLAVNAKDAVGNAVYKSGVYDEVNAELKTDDATALNRALTSTIDATTANAVMVYERVTGICTNSSGNAIFPDPTVGTPVACTGSPALTNNFILFDNRIPPKGLDYAAARLAGVKFWSYDANMAPVEDTARFSAAQLAGGYDEVTYRFTAAPGQILSASVDVMWQTHTREFMEHLRTQDTSTVRPEGPPNVFDPNYPNNPTYLSASIAGQPLSAYTALDGTALNDNWGGVAYASWLATGKGAPFLVDSDSSAVTGAPATAPTVSVRALNAADPDYMDPVTLAPDAFAAKIEWTPVADADGYMIWVRYGVSEATADWDRLAVVGKGVTSHTEYVFNPGKTYGFKVVAFNGKGETTSNVVNHTVASGLPAAPTTLVASDFAPDSTGSSISLTWNDNADNEAGFEIWRFGPMIVDGVPQVYTGQPPVTIIGAQGGLGTQTGGPAGGVPTTGANAYVDADPVLTPNTCYNYQVRAVNALIEVSTWSNVDQGCTTAAAAAAVAVNLMAAPASGTRVDLTWNSTGAGVVNYRVSRGATVLTTVAKTAAPTYTFADTTVIPATTYTYTVEALDAANMVLATATAIATTPAVPAAPTNAQAMVNGAQVTVTWLDNANNEDGFVVERAAVVNGVVGAWQPIPAVGAFLAPNTQQYLDTTALEAGTSVYRVMAIHLVNGNSGYATSNQVTLGLNAPTNLTGVLAMPAMTDPTPYGTAQVTLNWLDTSLKETAYRVERCIGTTNFCNNGANWTVLNAALAANTQQYVDQPATSSSSRTARYRVTATMGALASQRVVTTLTIPARAGTPTSLAVADVGGNNHDTLRVTFRNNFSSPVGYQLARCAGNSAACSGNPATNGNWTVLPSATGTGNRTVNDSGLTAGTTYYYEVRAYNAGGWSSWSGRQSRQVQ